MYRKPDCCCFSARYACRYCMVRIIKPWFLLWFIGITAAWDYWFPLSFGKSAWCFLLSRNFVLMEEEFRRVPAQSPLGPISDMNSNFRNRDVTFQLWDVLANKHDCNSLNILGDFWATQTNHAK